MPNVYDPDTGDVGSIPETVYLEPDTEDYLEDDEDLYTEEEIPLDDVPEVDDPEDVVGFIPANIDWANDDSPL